MKTENTIYDHGDKVTCIQDDQIKHLMGSDSPDLGNHYTVDEDHGSFIILQEFGTQIAFHKAFFKRSFSTKASRELLAIFLQNPKEGPDPRYFTTNAKF